MTSTPLIDWKRWRKGVACLVGISIAILAVKGNRYGEALVNRADRAFGDWIIFNSGGAPVRKDLVLLGIDESSMSLEGLEPEEIKASPTLELMGTRFPWDRRVWADVIDRLAGAGARLIVIDLVFSEPSDPNADAALEAAVQRHADKVILSSVFSPTEANSDVITFTLVEPNEQFVYGEREIRMGYVNFYKDPVDGLVRNARYTSTLGFENEGKRRKGEPEFRSLAGEVIHALGKEVPAGEHELRFAGELNAEGKNIGGSEVYAPKSISGIFVKKIWEDNYDNGNFFRDKVVLLGPVAARFHDVIDTPMGPITGPQMHLQAIGSGLEKKFINRSVNPWPIMLILGIFALVWTHWVKRPLVSIFGLMTVAGAIIMSSILVGDSLSLVFPVFGGLIVLVSGWVVAQSYDLVTERLEKGRLRRDFRRFVSRDVADALVDQPEMWQDCSGGVKRRVVVLFSDVRGFTERSEQSDPKDLVNQLNEYLTVMVAVVFNHGGTLDKFIGDAVMAHWGALGGGTDEDNSRKALLAGREMIKALDQLNTKWETQGKSPFKIGVGLHLGEVVAGEIGSPDRTEFGIIGDAVNLASRLEGLTKTFGCDVIFSDEVRIASGVSDGFIDMGMVRVKGRKTPGNLFGIGDETEIREHLELLDRDASGVIVMTTK